MCTELIATPVVCEFTLVSLLLSPQSYTYVLLDIFRHLKHRIHIEFLLTVGSSESTQRFCGELLRGSFL